MILFTAICRVVGASMIGVFSSDEQVVAVGEEYLRIVSWTFAASGVIFVVSSMFQALGHTLPALMASFSRIVLVAIPAFFLSRMPGFQLHWIWWLSVGALIVQLALGLLLLRREMRLRSTLLPRLPDWSKGSGSQVPPGSTRFCEVPGENEPGGTL
jgi:Na+-driven multidrug efflux pump